jgi:hypothetical protein
MAMRGRFFGAKARDIVVVAERRPGDRAGSGDVGKREPK